jgi:hypothetical protein
MGEAKTFFYHMCHDLICMYFMWTLLFIFVWLQWVASTSSRWGAIWGCASTSDGYDMHSRTASTFLSATIPGKHNTQHSKILFHWGFVGIDSDFMWYLERSWYRTNKYRTNKKTQVVPKTCLSNNKACPKNTNSSKILFTEDKIGLSPKLKQNSFSREKDNAFTFLLCWTIFLPFTDFLKTSE